MVYINIIIYGKSLGVPLNILSSVYDSKTFCKQSFNILVHLCSWADWFEPYLVANPEDRTSHVAAHLSTKIYIPGRTMHVYDFDTIA